jgi:hypothetical protein
MVPLYLFEHANPSEESMKKYLLAFSLFALGSFQLHAAPCTLGSTVTLASLQASGCEITNGPNTWSLQGFTQSAPAQGLIAGVTDSQINIQFALWGLGFQVTTSWSGGNFRVDSPQNLFLETNYRISGGVDNTGITVFGGSINPPPASTPAQYYNAGTGGTQLGGPTTAELRKFVQRLDSLLPGQTRVQQLVLANYSDLPNSLTNFYPPASLLNASLIAPNGGTLVVVDRLDLQAFRTGGFAEVASFTNYFAPTAQPTGDIPEPMTFALMGAGLIGLAILRRRQK